MQVPVEDLIKGMIVQSGNDATVALAEGVGGTVERFVQLMNDQAKALAIVRKRWPKVSEPAPMIGGNGCVLVHVQGESGGSMWLGIEPDGYTHS